MILRTIRRRLQRRSAETPTVHSDAGRAAHHPMFRRVLCNVDFSRQSMRAVMFALAVGTAVRSTVVLLYVLDAMPGSPCNAVRVRRAARRLANLVGAGTRADCDVRELVVIGSLVDGVISMANAHQVDLVVLSQPIGLDDREWLLTVDRLLVGLRCPLVLVPRSPLLASTAPSEVA
jgi:nucleotide-binding universal stress UspA family protein